MQITFKTRPPSAGVGTAIAFAMACGAAASGQPLTPHRMAPVPPALRSVLSRLSVAVERRDQRGLRSLCSPAFQADDERPAGAESWRGPSPGLWSGLSRAIELGGDFPEGRDDVYVTPWPAARWPQNLPRAGRVAVISPRAAIRAAPSPDARIRAVSGYEVLRGAGAHERVPAGWAKVRTPHGIYGYISAERTWRPEEPRIVLERGRDGSWRISEIRRSWPSGSRLPPFTIPPAASTR
jgi:hypothetical protein